jgi:hypothetical protein
MQRTTASVEVPLELQCQVQLRHHVVAARELALAYQKCTHFELRPTRVKLTIQYGAFDCRAQRTNCQLIAGRRTSKSVTYTSSIASNALHAAGNVPVS